MKRCTLGETFVQQRNEHGWRKRRCGKTATRATYCHPESYIATRVWDGTRTRKQLRMGGPIHRQHCAARLGQTCSNLCLKLNTLYLNIECTARWINNVEHCYDSPTHLYLIHARADTHTHTRMREWVETKRTASNAWFSICFCHLSRQM